MSFELKIYKEMATLNATATEWLQIRDIVNCTQPDGEFKSLFGEMILALTGSYNVVIETLIPFTEVTSLAQFADEFDSRQQAYQGIFLQQASKPRHFTEAAHEHYLVLSTMKEIKTTYPLLKRSFDNLYQFMDKWITNDAWLVMGCDVIFKTLNRLLLEISTYKKQDIDEAWLIYHTFTPSLKGFVELLNSTYTKLQTSTTF